MERRKELHTGGMDLCEEDEGEGEEEEVERKRLVDDLGKTWRGTEDGSERDREMKLLTERKEEAAEDEERGGCE